MIKTVVFVYDVVLRDGEGELVSSEWHQDEYPHSKAEYKMGYYNDVSGVTFWWDNSHRTFVPISNIKFVEEE